MGGKEGQPKGNNVAGIW